MQNKRGLSNIVATVLIILLALGAVSIVWFFVQSTLNQASTSITLTQKCLNVEAKPTVCIGEYSTGTGTGNSIVRVQLARGEALSLLAIVENANGETFINSPTAGATLDTTSIPIHTTGNITKARAAVRVSDEEGNELTCEESPTEINCDITTT